MLTNPYLFANLSKKPNGLALSSSLKYCGAAGVEPPFAREDRMRVDYHALTQSIVALTAGETDEIALMATLACEIHHSDDRFDWTGFYRVTAPGLLKIGPYQGGHGCLVIPFDKGVCGAAARSETTQLVPDVNAFPGHIACASSTRSELVIPVFAARGLIGVLDIDSDRPDAFDAEDAKALETILASVFSDL
jgi:GAF domain-containing protein